MREAVGKANIQPILTGARTTTEQGVQQLMQKTLDSYGSGIEISQVQMQKVDPPAQVIDSFRDVQAARADLERLQNEAQTYANRVVPDAKRTRRADHAGCRRLQATGGRRGARPERPLPEGL